MTFGMANIIIPENIIMSTIGFFSIPRRFNPVGIVK